MRSVPNGLEKVVRDVLHCAVVGALAANSPRTSGSGYTLNRNPKTAGRGVLITTSKVMLAGVGAHCRARRPATGPETCCVRVLAYTYTEDRVCETVLCMAYASIMIGPNQVYPLDQYTTQTYVPEYRKCESRAEFSDHTYAGRIEI